jgi:hypothetical protein
MFSDITPMLLWIHGERLGQGNLDDVIGSNNAKKYTVLNCWSRNHSKSD